MHLNPNDSVARGDHYSAGTYSGTYSGGFDDLDPDAVMVVPSSNDNHGSGSVLPNGSLWRGSPAPDDLGGPHTLTYHIAFVGSFASERRWTESMAMLRAAEV